MSTESVEYKLEGPTMGTMWEVRFFGPLSVVLESLHTELQAAVDEVCAQMSPWDEASTASQINALNLGQELQIPEWTWQVLETGLDVSELSHGAFELAVLDAVNDWGFGAAPGKDSPTPQPRPRAKSAFDLDPASRKLKKLRHTALDFCGIAKGFGADQLAAVLVKAGFPAYFVAIDGEVVAGEAPADRSAWTLGVEHPLFFKRNLYQSFSIVGQAAATSGNYRHFRDLGGLRYAHSMDAATGWPTDSDLSSVTVLAKTCMEADAWATALLVKGDDKGVEFAEHLGLAALFLMETEDGLIEYRTEAFKAL